MNIRVDLNTSIKDGTEVVFRSPVDCSQVTGLKVYYDGGNASQEFAFADAHGNNVGDIDHLFAENVAVKVILDVTTGMAFVQNADTNAYLEGRFNEIEESVAPCLIVTSTMGDSILLTDSAEQNLRGLVLYGKSTQDGVPTPEAPVDIVRTGDDGSIVVTVNDTQTLTALTPNGLPGIKVSKGGNYTDSNGQQWVCDEMDFAAGVYRKWIDSYTFTGTETNLSYYSGGADVLPTLPLPNAAPEYGNCMSNMLTGATSYSNLMGYGNTVTTTGNAIVFHIAGLKGVGTTYPTHNDLKLAVLAKLKELADNGTPLTVYYQLVTPIETPLTANELAQYAVLHTTYPTTTVTNDENVGMRISYVADTKNYIDKKFTELAAAIVANA